MPSYGKLFILALTVSLLFGCTGPVVKTSENPRGVYHRVKKGETLWSISHAYHKDILDIVVANKIDNPDLIEVDSVIFIPGADRPEETAAAKAETTTKKEEAKPGKKSPPPPVAREEKKAQPIKPGVYAVESPPKDRPQQHPPGKAETKKISGEVHFIWPVKGTVIARFGIQPNGLKHNGIRIAAKEGTPVVAAAGGEVMFSSSIKYYGETVIIKHVHSYSTVYTFLKNRRVKVGDRVRRGDCIAFVGRPENGDGKPCLNFEIRQNNKPRNPLTLLPQ